MNTRNAFTMIELIFVIVVLGILAAVAVPKFAATRTDAEIAKARSTVAAVRSGIVNERQTRLFRGQNNFISTLDANATVNASGTTIFDNNGSSDNTIMMYGVITKKQHGWVKSANNEYTFELPGQGQAVFTYNPGNGTFDCAASSLCSSLTN